MSICTSHFERKLLGPPNCIEYAHFVFESKERKRVGDGVLNGSDWTAALGKVAGCLLRNVEAATRKTISRNLLKMFTGDQVYDLCALCKGDPLVVWILCLTWVCVNHGTSDVAVAPSLEESEILSESGGSSDALSISIDSAEFSKQRNHLPLPSIPTETISSAKEDLADLLFILNLHSFTLQEFTLHVEPHLSLFPSKTKTRLETHYAKEKQLSDTRRTSLGSLYDANQVLSHSQSELVISRITALQQELNSRWTTSLKLVFTASQHSFSNAKFHTACNHRGPTLTVIKLKSGDIVGGYTDKSWSSDSTFHYSPNAFLFSFPVDESGNSEMRVFPVKSEGYAILGIIQATDDHSVYSTDHSCMDTLSSIDTPTDKVAHQETFVHHRIRNHQIEHWEDLFRLQISIIPSIWKLVLAVTLWATLVCVFALVEGVDVLKALPGYNAGYTAVVGVVLSLLLGFRVNASYDRWWEGRKLWSSIHFNAFNLGRLIRVTVKTSTPEEESAQLHALKLLTGFPVAVKHRLRKEYHKDFTDLSIHISHIFDHGLPHSISSPITIPHHTRNIPLDILTHMQIYLQSHGQSAPPLCNTISALSELWTQLERIATTPVPAGYEITLLQVMFLYFLAIPFQLVPLLAWGTIPVVMFGAFVMLGIFEISFKIENPFGHFMHDLPVDSYCEEIMEHLETVKAYERAGGVGPAVVDSKESRVGLLQWGEVYGLHEMNVHVHHGGVQNSAVHLDKSSVKRRKGLFAKGV
ncbi:UNVERIFIED_CONTAM: hypothetical protein HDU68_003007 [Siphonaria sp. JEL0065]|nr:hypothetical protein HDU68_003007 [Siphonaria sp. JEL0065]